MKKALSPATNSGGGSKMHNFLVYLRQHWQLYVIFMLPAFLLTVIFRYIPMGGISIAFTEYNPIRGLFHSEWIGFDNFTRFLSSPDFMRYLVNTLKLSVFGLLWGFPAPILLALLLNEMRSMKYKRVVQTITYMPYFISLVVMCGILTDFCSTTGLFAEIQKLLGVESPVNLLGDAKYFRTVYVGSEIWQRLGWDSIIFLSALAGIDSGGGCACLSDFY